MGNETVKTEALEETAQALAVYINDVESSLRKMRDAAQDCSDNMGNDVISSKNIEKLEECISQLTVSVSQAEELRETVLREIRETEDFWRE